MPGYATFNPLMCSDTETDEDELEILTECLPAMLEIVNRKHKAIQRKKLDEAEEKLLEERNDLLKQLEELKERKNAIDAKRKALDNESAPNKRFRFMDRLQKQIQKHHIPQFNFQDGNNGPPPLFEAELGRDIMQQEQGAIIPAETSDGNGALVDLSTAETRNDRDHEHELSTNLHDQLPSASASTTTTKIKV